MIPFIIEAELVNPEFFSLYVGNAHGFLLGMLAFFFGFLFVAIGDNFWNAVVKMRTVSLLIAFGLYFLRLIYFDLNAPHYLSSIESMNWIFAVLGFGYQYLNKPSSALRYLSQAVYPIYIIHMIFLYLGAYLLLPLNLGLGVNLILIVLFTFTGCAVTYELLIKRIGILRPLFGLKEKERFVIKYE
jgi:hypothetical protein